MVAPNFLNTVPQSALVGTLTDSATSMTVTTGDGAKFPAVEFNLRIRDSAGTKTPEVCRVTAKATDVFTVTRGYDNTTNQAWSDGDIVEHVVVAEDMDKAWGATAHTVSSTEPVLPSEGDVWVNPSASAGAGPFAGTWLDALFNRLETVHADDQEFDGVIGGTAVTPSGTATWTQSRGVLGVVFDSQASADYAARLYPLTSTTFPVTLETAMRVTSSVENYHIVGLVFADGTATTSNMEAGGVHLSTSKLVMRAGTFTNVSGTGQDGSVMSGVGQQSHTYLRLIWTAANTFKLQTSPDGTAWTGMDIASHSATLTPTYIGVFVYTGASTQESAASFEYLRVTESDLSA